MTTTVLKTCFKKQNPKLIVCRKDKNYDNILFRKEFLSKLRDLLPNDKRKRAIMIRSELRNEFLRDRTDSNKKAYYKQRNICVKSKKQYYSNL